MFETLLQQMTLSELATPAIRMTAATLLGGLLGLEREFRHRPAGLRTHMLISLAACLFTLMAFVLLGTPSTEEERLRIDPLRLIEAITSGVAFLAAGTILTSQDKVRGLTTGASMWLAGAIGLACGLGEYGLGGMAAVFGLVVLRVLRPIKKGIDHNT